MKKQRKGTHRLLFFIIGVTAVILVTVLIHKSYQFHQERIQAEEWQVRHQEVQSELEDVQFKIQELSGDGEALQEFLDEELNPAIVIEEPAAVEIESNDLPEEDAAAVNTGGVIEAGSNAIVVEEPEAVSPVPQTEDGIITEAPLDAQSISENRAAAEAAEAARAAEEAETVSENRAAEAARKAEEAARAAEEAETVSENRAAEAARKAAEEEAKAAEEAETVSENRAAEAARKAEEAARAAEEAETVSYNRAAEAARKAAEEAAKAAEENTISGNAIVDGQVVPFRYQETEITLEQRRAVRSSYEETVMVNAEDKKVIANNTLDFTNMKIACLGDSLTSGNNMSSVEENYEQYTYPAVLSNLLRTEQVYNLGIGGSSYGRYWDQAFVDRYSNIPADSDIILVMGGTNDGYAASAEELGSIEEKKARTFYGDVDELMRGLKQNYPDAKIIFATPLPNVLHDYLRNQRDYLMPQSVFVNAIKELAAQYSIDVIDLYNSNILDTHDAQVISAYMPDGVHGNSNGYGVLAEHFASEIIQIMERDALYGPSATISANIAEAADGTDNISDGGINTAAEKTADAIVIQ